VKFATFDIDGSFLLLSVVVVAAAAAAGNVAATAVAAIYSFTFILMCSDATLHFI
jgi:hypothetical protein